MVTGRDYYELARERIYRRAGMVHAEADNVLEWKIDRWISAK